MKLTCSLFFLCWVFLAPVANAQEDAEDTILSFTAIETKPTWPGCEHLKSESDRFQCFQVSMMQFVSQHVVYPEEALRDSIMGKVYVQFIIEKDGSINEVNCVRAVHPLLDNAAMKVVRAMPTLQPALQRGKPVRMQYVLPINFAF